MSKKTIALIISLVVLTVALLAIALSTKQPSVQTPDTQISTNAPTPTPPAHTVLSLSPNPLTAVAGTNEIVVDINSNGNEVTTVQLELSYDPKLISNIKVTKGDFLENAVELLNKNDISTGRISYALGILPSQAAKNGAGIVARITFNARYATLLTKDTELTLLPKSLVTASGISPSVLKEARSTKIILPTSGTAQPLTQTPSVPVASPSTTIPTQ